MEGTPACPSCREPIEKGCLVSESYFGGAKWQKARSTLALGGEKIGDFT